MLQSDPHVSTVDGTQFPVFMFVTMASSFGFVLSDIVDMRFPHSCV